MRCVTVLGPSQSGKTTLVEKLSHIEGRPSGAEADPLLSLTRFSFVDEEWCAIDVAGGPEAASLSGGALLASDAAILCVAPDPEAAVLAAPYIRAIEAAGTPYLVFINRMDSPEGRVRDVVAALQTYSAHVLALRQIPIREKGEVVGAVDLISERAWRYREGMPSALVDIPADVSDREAEARQELLEHMADFDDDLLTELIEDHMPATGALFGVASRVTQENRLVPVVLGSALHANGVFRLMKLLRHEAPQVEVLAARLADGGNAPVAASFHAQIRKHVGKSVFLRALTGEVRVGTELGGGNLGGLHAPGGKVPIEALGPGEIGLAVKADQLNAGALFNTGGTQEAPAWARGHEPVHSRIVKPSDERNEVRLSAALGRLQEIDPALRVAHDEASGHALLQVQGPMHLRRVLAILADDFGVEVTEEAPEASYRETISKRVEQHYRHKKQTGGAGQFADVMLTVGPRGRGDGFVFEDTVKGGAVPRNYIPSVEEGAKDALAKGPMGFPVIDVAVTLTDGKFHAVDSSEYAFRTAGRAGVQEALAAADPVLLQPINQVEIDVPSVFSGPMVPAMSGLKGHVLGFERNADAPGWDVFRALLPASAMEDLVRTLAANTQGTAWFRARFDHFEEIYGREADRIAKGTAAATA